jgi:hypothetical protein
MESPEDKKNHYDSASQPNESLGEFIRKRRMGTRTDLTKMSRETRINIDYLRAIERNDFDFLPAATYVRIFLKTIAGYLNLNDREIIAKYEKHVERARETELHQPALPPSGKNKKRNAVAIAVLLMLAACLTYLAVKSRPGPDTVVDEVPAPSDSIAVTIREDPVPDSPSVANVVDTGLAVQPDTVFSDEDTGLAPPDTVTTLKGKRFLMEDPAQKRFVILVKCLGESSWVWVYRPGRKRWANLFYKDDYKQFSSNAPIYIKISHPSKIRISVNSKPVPSNRLRTIHYRVDSRGLSSMRTESWESAIKELTSPEP